MNSVETFERAEAIAATGKAAIIEPDGRVVEVALPKAQQERRDAVAKLLGDGAEIRQPLRQNRSRSRMLGFVRGASAEDNLAASRSGMLVSGRAVLFDEEAG